MSYCNLTTTTVVSGVIDVTVLNTFEPVDVAPNVGPVISSVMELPAISVPTIVNVVEERSPASDNNVILPPNEV